MLDINDCKSSCDLLLSEWAAFLKNAGKSWLKEVSIPLHTSFCLDDDDTDVHDDEVGVEDGTGKSLTKLPPQIIFVSLGDTSETDVMIIHN